MERRRGAVETNISRDGRLPGERVQRLGLGDLVDKTPAGENVEEIGFIGAHRYPAQLCRGSPPRRRWCNRSGAWFNSTTRPAGVLAKARTCRVPNVIVDLDQGDRVDERLKYGNNIGGS